VSGQYSHAIPNCYAALSSYNTARLVIYVFNRKMLVTHSGFTSSDTIFSIQRKEKLVENFKHMSLVKCQNLM